MGLAALEMMKRLTAYMDPEYLVSDSTYVQQQFQQGKIAIANLWASRAGAMDEEGESQVVGLVRMASAPAAVAGSRPASTLWWDGVVFAKNMSDEVAEAAFRVAMEGLDREMVEANNDIAVWLIDGFMLTPISHGRGRYCEQRRRPLSGELRDGPHAYRARERGLRLPDRRQGRRPPRWRTSRTPISPRRRSRD